MDGPCAGPVPRAGTAIRPSAAGSLGDPESIDVLGTTGGVERITLDLTGGVFGPDFTVEGNVPEIEIAMALGSGADQVVVIGTSGNDSIAMGLNGLSLNAGGGVDVTFRSSRPPSRSRGSTASIPSPAATASAPVSPVRGASRSAQATSATS